MKKFLLNRFFTTIFLFDLVFSHLIFCQNFNPDWIVYNMSNSLIPSNYIKTVYIDNNQVIHIGSGISYLFEGQGGLTIIGENNWINYGQNELGNCNNWVNSIIKDRTSGNLFLGLGSNGVCGGGVLMQTNDGWLKIINAQSGNDRDVTFLYQSTDGSIWVGYCPYSVHYHQYCKGIDVIIDTQVTNITNEIGLPSPVYTSCVQVNDEIWVSAAKFVNYWGMYNGGVARRKNNIWEIFTIDNSNINATSAYSLQRDQNGNIWLGTEDGLRKFDGEAWSVINHLNSGIPIDKITSLAIDSSNNLWFGQTWNSGLIKYDGSNFSVFTTDNSELPSNNINYLAVDHNNNLWIATDNGLAIFNENGITNIMVNEQNYNFILKNNYPNPFNSTTSIKYIIPTNEFVRIQVYDIIGRKIKTLVNQFKFSGNYTITFSDHSLPSGIYICKMEAGSYSKSIKMLLLK
jgi:hypothetical protein